MKVLATRPEKQNIAWLDKLRHLGFDAVACPLMQICEVVETSQVQAIKDTILHLDEYTAAVFVSQNAVDFGLAWIDKYWPQVPIGLAWYAVGTTTAKRLHSHPLLNTVQVSAAHKKMNSEELLAAPGLQAQQIAGRKIVIFRGLGGRPMLAQVLQQRGAHVHYCELYRRAKPSAPQTLKIAAKVLTKITIVPVFSGEALQNFCEVFRFSDDQRKNIVLVVPGNRVFEVAKQQGFKFIEVASNASEPAMLNAIENAISKLS